MIDFKIHMKITMKFYVHVKYIDFKCPIFTLKFVLLIQKIQIIASLSIKSMLKMGVHNAVKMTLLIRFTKLCCKHMYLYIQFIWTYEKINVLKTCLAHANFCCIFELEKTQKVKLIDPLQFYLFRSMKIIS